MDFLSSLPSIQVILDQWLINFLLIIARVAGFVVRAPLFSEPNIPALAKAAIIILFSILCSSLINVTNISSEYHTLFLLITNFAVGYLIGFIANLAVNIAQVAGEVIDIQTGLNSAAVMEGGVQATVFSRVLKHLALLLFAYFGGLEIAIQSVKLSFSLFPLDATNFTLLGFTLDNFIKMTRDVLMLGVTTASPVLVVIVFTDIVLGLMSRAAQQINPFQLSFSLKPIIGMLIVMLCIPLIQAKINRIVFQNSNIFSLSDLEENPYSIDKINQRIQEYHKNKLYEKN